MIEIITVEQGTDEWRLARLGIPTASRFADVLAKGRNGEASKTRDRYLRDLAGEIITGEPAEAYNNGHMERGKVLESEARNLYALVADVDPELVGFVRNGDKGASPDALVNSDGILEIKTKLPAILIECLLKDDFPPEHKAQCQGALMVCEREWVDIAVYYPKMPIFVKRAYRDNAYIRTLEKAVSEFNSELQEIVARVRAYGQDVTA
jgi:hypothetical protein